jgi:hypothetical protein
MSNQTYGQKACGVSLPSNSYEVAEIKNKYADIIDYLNDLRVDLIARKEAGKASPDNVAEVIRMISIAITETQTAQMWAVKSITWGL